MQSEQMKIVKDGDTIHVMPEMANMGKAFDEFTTEADTVVHNLRQKELETAIEAGLLARAKIMEIYNQDFDVEIKDDNSPVTNADKAADAIIREHLHKAFPTHAFLTEESEDNKERLIEDYHIGNYSVLPEYE